MQERKLIWAAYIAVCVFWGSTYLAIRIGVQELPPFLFAGIRFLIAGGIILGFASYKGLQYPQCAKDYRAFSVIGLLLLFGGNGMVVLAEQWVHSGIASLLVATVPLFMALIEFIFVRKERLSWRGWLGLVVGFAGVGILVIGDGLTSAVNPLGALLLILACLSWASGSVYSKTLKPTGSVVTHIGIQMVAGGTALTGMGLFMGEASRFKPSMSGIGAMVYLIIFGSLIGYSAYIYLLQKWPAARVGTYAYVNPVIAVLLGALVLREPLTLTLLIATAVILFGVLLVQTSKQTVPQKSPLETSKAIEKTGNS